MRLVLGFCSLATIALWTALATPAAAGSSCSRAGSRTEAANQHVRIYLWRDAFYGCAYERGGSFYLGIKHFSCIGAAGCEGIEQVRVAGRYVAYSWHRNSGLAEPTDAGAILVRNLATGRYKHEHQVGRYLHDAVIGGFRVTRSGALGYIVDRTPRVHGADPDRRLEVWRMDVRGRRRLDRGSRIRRDSLRLDGRRFSWINGSSKRTTTLR